MQESCCTTAGVSIGGGIGDGRGVSKMLSFYIKVSYVMGNELSDNYPVCEQVLLPALSAGFNS